MRISLSVKMRSRITPCLKTRDKGNVRRSYATFRARNFTFAHHFFVALMIAARPAADKTRFFAPKTSRSVVMS
jgi:hypothetical protein